MKKKLRKQKDALRKEILEAMIKVKQEYEEDRHVYLATSCPLCKIGEIPQDCMICPMGAFIEKKHIFGCSNRKCKGDSSPKLSEKQKARVIEFYTQAIKEAQNYKNLRGTKYTQTYTPTPFGLKLRQIDEEIYNKYRRL